MLAKHFFALIFWFHPSYRWILKGLGDDLTEEEIDDMIRDTDTDGSGFVDFDGKFIHIYIGCSNPPIGVENCNWSIFYWHVCILYELSRNSHSITSILSRNVW